MRRSSVRWMTITAGVCLLAMAGCSAYNPFFAAGVEKDSGVLPGVYWSEFPVGDGVRDWFGVAGSGDLTALVAAVQTSGYLCTSADSGATWTRRTAAGQRDWQSVASSADGTRLAAAAMGGLIYTDAGGIWTEHVIGGGPQNWQCIAMSADGVRLAAVAYGGYIHTSANGGADWTERSDPSLRDWRHIACSADGTRPSPRR